MREIEVKILEIKPEEIRAKLSKLGAKKVFDDEMEIVNLDFPDGRINKAHELLRIRKLGDKVELCFKDGKEASPFKIMEETEVLTDNYEKTIKIFEKIGLKKIYSNTKKRESYTLGHIKFDIDTYKGIPTYIEVEAPSEKEVEEYVNKLGYKMEQTTNMSAWEVAEYYRSQK